MCPSGWFVETEAGPAHLGVAGVPVGGVRKDW